MLMIYNNKPNCFEEKCPTCGYSYNPNYHPDIGDVPFYHVKEDIHFTKESSTGFIHSDSKPLHICPKCGTIGITIY